MSLRLSRVKRRFESSVPKHCSALMLNALHAEFERRFGDLLTFDDILTNSLKHSLMLTVSHPYFKLRWLTNSGDKKIAGALFLASATFYVLNRWEKAHPLSHFAHPVKPICPNGQHHCTTWRLW
jgi:hypothetical protein